MVKLMFVMAALSLIAPRSQAGSVSTTLQAGVTADVSQGVVTPQDRWIHVRDRSQGPEIHAIVEFDLQSLDPTQPVASAILNLTVLGMARSSTGPNWMDVYVHGYAGDNQATPEDDLVDNIIAGPYRAEWIFSPIWPDMSAVDVTDQIQALLSQQAVSAGFLLTPDNFFGAGFLQIDITASPNAIGGARYPELTIIQVPEPATFVLLAVSALVVRRRACR